MASADTVQQALDKLAETSPPYRVGYYARVTWDLNNHFAYSASRRFQNEDKAADLAKLTRHASLRVQDCDVCITAARARLLT